MFQRGKHGRRPPQVDGLIYHILLKLSLPKSRLTAAVHTPRHRATMPSRRSRASSGEKERRRPRPTSMVGPAPEQVAAIAAAKLSNWKRR
jgi:hypothetical protein